MAVRTGSGSISVLVDKNLATLVTALRGLDKDLNIQLRRQTKAVAEPVWAEAVRANTSSIMESRVLGDTARVSVSATNVRLRAGHVGKLKSGAQIPALANAIEFGANANKQVKVTNRHGTKFTRRNGARFRTNRRNGYVVFPAAREVIPRLAALWTQTTVRALHEAFEKGGAR